MREGAEKTHADVVLEVLQDGLALELLRGGQEPVLRRPLDLGQDDRLQGLSSEGGAGQ